MVTRCDLEPLNSIGIYYFATNETKIGGKIKATHEDFIVNEILQDGTILTRTSSMRNPAREGGLYTWAILEKKGVDTFSAVQKIANFFQIPVKDIQYAGLKDAQGMTRQVISFWNLPLDKNRQISVTDNITIKSLGRVPNPVNLNVIKGNNFQIRITECDAHGQALVNHAKEIATELKSLGILNYFDLQRFGNTRPISHLVGMKLLEGEYQSAAMLYLTSISSEERTYLRNLRTSLAEGTISLNEFLKKIPPQYSIEKTLAKSLLKGMNNPWKVIDKKIVNLFLSAVQSHAFNWMLSALVTYYEKSVPTMKAQLPPALPVIGTGMNWSKYPGTIKDACEELITDFDFQQLIKLMTKNNKTRNKRAYHVKFHERKWNVIPENLTIKISEENNSVILFFDLPKGSYGTIVAREFTKNIGF